MLAAMDADNAALTVAPGGRSYPAQVTFGTDVLQRLPAAVLLALVLVVLFGSRAQAHGGAPDGSNFSSAVVAVAPVREGRPAADPASLDGVVWQVVGADAVLQLTNTSGRQIVVAGYEGEPFLRVGPDGVFENRRSPATYLNADRYGAVEVPASADSQARPDWRKRSSGTRWQWHDHRIHWMARTLPPQAQQQPAQRHRILQWEVPFGISQRSMVVRGELWWIPAGPAWPWLTSAATILALPIAAARTAGATPRTISRIAVTMIVLVAVANVALSIGDVLATPATLGAHSWAVTQALVPVIVAIGLAGAVWQDVPEDDANADPLSLLVAAGILAAGCGLARVGELQASQIVNALPTWSVRAVIAASLMIVVPGALMVLRPARSAATP